jgi:hypothetical protein
MKLLQQLWRDEDGIVVTSDFVLLSTILLTGTIVGIFVVRTATLKLFVNVAVGMSRQQTHKFDKDDVNQGADEDKDGIYGYQEKHTDDFPLYELDGETPEEINVAPAQPEGSTSYGGGSGG